MIFTKSSIPDVLVIDIQKREDQRGFFGRVYCEKELASEGVDFDIVQINRSLTVEKGTIRGLHFQTSPKQEGKIVQCLKGKIFDVAVDVRKDSPTYKKWFGIELSEDNNKMLYVPKGFAHGFETLTENCLVEYFVSEFYSPEYEKGIIWNDKSINISWPILNPHLSAKDSSWPSIE